MYRIYRKILNSDEGDFEILVKSGIFLEDQGGFTLMLLHTWKMGGCIVYTGIMLLLLFVPLFFSFFFLSNFQTLKI